MLVKILVAVGALTCAAHRSHAQVPLARGLTLTWVSSLSREPDYESRVEILDSTDVGVSLRNSWNRGSKQGAVQWRTADRDLLHEIRLTTRSFYASLGNSNHEPFVGSTFLMGPAAVLADLKAKGRTDVEFVIPEFSFLPFTGTLTREGVEPFPVVLNDKRVTLRGVRARGVFENSSSKVPSVRLSFLFLDDSVSPWLLEVELRRPDGFRGHKQLARISYRPNVEAELAARCRATVYDIHFATASAAIDPASAATIGAIAKAMSTHRDWKIEIVGHTDSIGAAGANLDLSRRRADATRLALVTTHGIGATRLRADGRGEDQPVEDNGTLAGRARNRRVELLRNCERGAGATP
jgi:outer membrane protein OmpA-like peptidoglycan-associated protein